MTTVKRLKHKKGRAYRRMREAMWDSRLSAWDSHVRDIVPREGIECDTFAVVGNPAWAVLLEQPNHGGTPRLTRGHTERMSVPRGLS